MRRRLGTRYTEKRSIAEINVVPLADLALVLLIIFVVAAPMLQMGIDVDLPKVTSKSIDVHEEKLILTINDKREIFINKHKTSMAELRGRLENIFTKRIDREIYMRADQNIPYGFVVEVMAEVRKSGVDKLSMITEPPERSR